MALTTEAALRKDKTTNTSTTMQHRHMAFIASVLADCHDLANCGTIARRFAAALAQSNPRFDRARFIKACGLED